MKTFKKVVLKSIAMAIAFVILISPINVFAAVIAPKIDELFHKDEYVGASDAYLATADIQIDNNEYYPESADISEEHEYIDNSIDGANDISSYASIPGDPMVYYTQKWLNQEYGNVSGFGSVTENGKTGWDVVYGLLRALQYELGITSLSNNFGPSTSSKYSANPLSRNDGVTNKKYAILQCALWCKGYCPGYNISYNESTDKVTINAVFDADVENAVKELKTDAGFTNPNGVVTLNVMKALMSMDSFKLLGSSYGAKAEVRTMQQEFNRKYENYIGLIPCDGVYGRSTNKALIYAFQAEEGLPVGVANGNFGPTTRNCTPNIPYVQDSSAALSYQGNYYTAAKISVFTKLLQFALFVNGFGNGSFNGNYDSATKQAVKDFQDFYALSVTGKVDMSTWMSLFLSSGDPNRSALGADCAMILNAARAKTLYDYGYRYVGRYLTGTYGSNRISKALTVEEEQIILDAGLRFFPIYQDGGTRLEYFTAAQGKSDGEKAVNAALNLGIPQNTIIYFAVDFDALEYQVNSNVIPYFREVFNQLNGTYRVGIYAPRYVCTLVANAGYSCSSFVGDMSTGFSGNLGYKIPDNWAFSQFANLEGDNALGTGDGRIEIDKDAVSGKDQGVCKLTIANNNSSSTQKSVNLGKSSEDTMVGPSINILGKDINLFELNIGFNINSTDLYMESCYDAKEQKTKVIIGMRVNGENTETTGDREKVNKHKEAYEEVKKTYYALGKSPSEFTRRFNGIKGSLFDNGGKVIFDSRNNIFGFFEYSTITGELVDGGLGIVSESSMSVSYPITPIPSLYFKIEIKGSITGELKFILTKTNYMDVRGELEFAVQPNLGLEVNVLVASAYAGINGTIDCKLKFPIDNLKDSFEAELSAGVFFEYDALLWANRWDWNFFERKLYPSQNVDNLSIFSINKNDLKFIEPLSQISAYSLSTEPNIFKNNMQVYCKPQIINLGNDKLMMVYIDDSQNRTAENRTILMYSIYENDNWSIPQVVSDDSTADFNPIIKSDGNGGAHIVWQNATRLFDNTVTLDEMATNIDLQYIHWNGNSFDNSAAITSNNNDMEMSYAIASNDDEISVVWVQNSENDTLGLSGTNSVYRKEFSNNSWNTTETIDTDLQIVSSIDTTYDGNDNVIAYTVKTGTDTTTIEDLEIFYYDGQSVSQLTDDSIPDYSVTFSGNEMYWVNGNSLVQATDGDLDTKTVIVENMDITANGLSVLENESGNKAIVWEQTEENSNAFYTINYNGTTNSFENEKPLSSTLGSVRGWDACMLSNGEIEMAYCLVQNDNSLNLMQKKMNQFSDISVDSIIYDGEISGGNNINIVADVSNKGSLSANQFTVNIYDNENNLINSQTVDEVLEIGQSAQIEIPYTLPSTISRTDYTVEILPKNQTDIFLNDNKGVFSIGFSDVLIENVVETRIDGGRKFDVTIKNNGYETANDITIDLLKDSQFGEIIESETISNLAPSASTIVSLEVDNTYLDTSVSANPRTLFISVQTSSVESNYGNNVDTITVYPDYDINVVADKGGTVSGSGIFEYNTTTTITAVPDEGYVFYAWYEDGYILYNTPATYEVIANTNRTLKAIFVVDPEYPATISGTVKQLATLDGTMLAVAPGLDVSLNNGMTTTTNAEGEFEFANVTTGAYIMTISGETTFDRSMLVVIDAPVMELGDIPVLCCDYVKDGVINQLDFDAWAQWLSVMANDPNYYVFADINGDKYVNAKDYAYIHRNFRNKTKEEINKCLD